ncbi:flippase-like domain-containing protein [Myxococcota bacterium]|nr:flippase-like domain-containing protein [Myxococcota bacterium]
MPRLLRVLPTLLLGLACLSLAFRGTRPRDLGAALAGADPGLVAASVFLYAGSMVAARALRFGVLVGRTAPVRPRDVATASGIGFLAMDALPMRLGELVRPWLLARRGVPFAATLGVVAAERLLDLAFVVPAVLAVAAFASIPPTAVDIGEHAFDAVDLSRGLLAGVAVPGALVLGAVLASGPSLPGRVRPLLAPLPPPLAGRALATLQSLAAGLGTLRHMPTLALAASLTALVWAGNAASLHLLVAAVDGPASPWAGPVMLSACFLFMLIPPPPLQLGLLEAAVVAGATLLGLERAPAVAAAAILRASHLGVLCAAAAAAMAWEGVPPREVLRAAGLGAPTPGARRTDGDP